MTKRKARRIGPANYPESTGPGYLAYSFGFASLLSYLQPFSAVPDLGSGFQQGSILVFLA